MESRLSPALMDDLSFVTENGLRQSIDEQSVMTTPRPLAASTVARDALKQKELSLADPRCSFINTVPSNNPSPRELELMKFSLNGSDDRSDTKSDEMGCNDVSARSSLGLIPADVMNDDNLMLGDLSSSALLMPNMSKLKPTPDLRSNLYNQQSSFGNRFTPSNQQSSLTSQSTADSNDWRDHSSKQDSKNHAIGSNHIVDTVKKRPEREVGEANKAGAVAMSLFGGGLLGEVSEGCEMDASVHEIQFGADDLQLLDEDFSDLEEVISTDDEEFRGLELKCQRTLTDDDKIGVNRDFRSYHGDNEMQDDRQGAVGEESWCLDDKYFQESPVVCNKSHTVLLDPTDTLQYNDEVSVVDSEFDLRYCDGEGSESDKQHTFTADNTTQTSSNTTRTSSNTTRTSNNTTRTSSNTTRTSNNTTRTSNNTHTDYYRPGIEGECYERQSGEGEVSDHDLNTAGGDGGVRLGDGSSGDSDDGSPRQLTSNSAPHRFGQQPLSSPFDEDFPEEERMRPMGDDLLTDTQMSRFLTATNHQQSTPPSFLVDDSYEMNNDRVDQSYDVLLQSKFLAQTNQSQMTTYNQSMAPLDASSFQLEDILHGQADQTEVSSRFPKDQRMGAFGYNAADFPQGDDPFGNFNSSFGSFGLKPNSSPDQPFSSGPTSNFDFGDSPSNESGDPWNSDQRLSSSREVRAKETNSNRPSLEKSATFPNRKPQISRISESRDLKSRNSTSQVSETHDIKSRNPSSQGVRPRTSSTQSVTSAKSNTSRDSSLRKSGKILPPTSKERSSRNSTALMESRNSAERLSKNSNISASSKFHTSTSTSTLDTVGKKPSVPRSSSLHRSGSLPQMKKRLSESTSSTQAPASLPNNKNQTKRQSGNSSLPQKDTPIPRLSQGRQSQDKMTKPVASIGQTFKKPTALPQSGKLGVKSAIPVNCPKTNLALHTSFNKEAEQQRELFDTPDLQIDETDFKSSDDCMKMFDDDEEEFNKENIFSEHDNMTGCGVGNIEAQWAYRSVMSQSVCTVSDDPWDQANRLSMGAYWAQGTENLGTLEGNPNLPRPNFGMTIRTPPSDRKPVALINKTHPLTDVSNQSQSQYQDTSSVVSDLTFTLSDLGTPQNKQAMSRTSEPEKSQTKNIEESQNEESVENDVSTLQNSTDLSALTHSLMNLEQSFKDQSGMLSLSAISSFIGKLSAQSDNSELVNTLMALSKIKSQAKHADKAEKLAYELQNQNQESHKAESEDVLKDKSDRRSRLPVRRESLKDLDKGVKTIDTSSPSATQQMSDSLNLNTSAPQNDQETSQGQASRAPRSSLVDSCTDEDWEKFNNPDRETGYHTDQSFKSPDRNQAPPASEWKSPRPSMGGHYLLPQNQQFQDPGQTSSSIGRSVLSASAIQRQESGQTLSTQDPNRKHSERSSQQTTFSSEQRNLQNQQSRDQCLSMDRPNEDVRQSMERPGSKTERISIEGSQASKRQPSLLSRTQQRNSSQGSIKDELRSRQTESQPNEGVVPERDDNMDRTNPRYAVSSKHTPEDIKASSRRSYEQPQRSQPERRSLPQKNNRRPHQPTGEQPLGRADIPDDPRQNRNPELRSNFPEDVRQPRISDSRPNRQREGPADDGTVRNNPRQRNQEIRLNMQREGSSFEETTVHNDQRQRHQTRPSIQQEDFGDNVALEHTRDFIQTQAKRSSEHHIPDGSDYSSRSNYFSPDKELSRDLVVGTDDTDLSDSRGYNVLKSKQRRENMGRQSDRESNMSQSEQRHQIDTQSEQLNPQYLNDIKSNQESNLGWQERVQERHDHDYSPPVQDRGDKQPTTDQAPIQSFHHGMLPRQQPDKPTLLTDKSLLSTEFAHRYLSQKSPKKGGFKMPFSVKGSCRENPIDPNDTLFGEDTSFYELQAQNLSRLSHIISDSHPSFMSQVSATPSTNREGMSPGYMQSILSTGPINRHYGDPSGTLKVIPKVLTSLEVPSVFTYPETTCVGIALSANLPITNPTSRWQECILYLKELSIDTKLVDPEKHSPFEMKNKIIIEPNSTDNVSVMFLPRVSGAFVGQLLIYAKPFLGNIEYPTSSIPVEVTIQAIAETPNIQIITNEKGRLNFGQMSWGSCSTSSIQLRNLNKSSVPVRLTITAAKTPWHCFTFDKELLSDEIILGSRSMTYGKNAMSLNLEGYGEKKISSVEDIKVYCKPPFKQPDRALYQRPPELFAAIVNVEIDSSVPNLPPITSVLLTAEVGLPKLHTAIGLEKIELSCYSGKTCSTSCKLKNAGNISMEVSLFVPQIADIFPVIPKYLTVPAGQEREVMVHFEPKDKKISNYDGLLLMVLEPDGPTYELPIRGEVKQEIVPPTGPLLLSNKNSLPFGGVAIGKSKQLKVVLKSNAQQTLKLRVEIRSTSSAFQFALSKEETGNTSQYKDVIIKPQERFPVFVNYSPQQIESSIGKLVIKPYDCNAKFSLPLSGYGGSSYIILQGVNQSGSLRYWCDVGEVKVGCSTMYKVTVSNTGHRAAFIKALAFTDLQLKQTLPPGRIAVDPNEFILHPNDSKVVHVAFCASDREVAVCYRDREVVATVTFYHGDEVSRQKYRRAINKPKKVKRQTTLPENLAVQKVNFDVSYAGDRDDLLLSEGEKISGSVDDVDLFYSNLTNVSMAMIGHPASKIESTTPQIHLKSHPMGGTLPVSNITRSDTSNRLGYTSYHPGEKDCDWSVLPPQLICNIYREGKKCQTGHFQIVNFSVKDIKFELSWPGHWFSVNPEYGVVKAKSNRLVTITPLPNINITKLPWSGGVVVCCNDQFEEVKVQLRNEPTCDPNIPTVESPSVLSTQLSDSFNKNTDIKHIDIPTTHFIFPKTPVDDHSGKVLEFTNTSSETLSWTINSFAPAYAKGVDKSSDIYRVTYSVFVVKEKSGQITPNQTAKIPLMFVPRSEGQFTQCWDLQCFLHPSITENSMTVKISLVGEAGRIEEEESSDEVSVSTDNSEKPDKKSRPVSIKEDIVNFKTMEPGKSTAIKIEFQNESDRPHSLKAISPEPPFHIKHHRFNIGKFRFLKYPIEFKTDVPGVYDGVLSFKTDLGYNLSIKLHGECLKL